MPTLLFLAIAYQIENIKWRYLFLTISAINLIFNIYQHKIIQEFYSAAIITLLFLMTPYFATWWRNRNNRNNPNSFKEFALDTYLIAKHNKLHCVMWISFLAVSILGACIYTGYTGDVLLGCLLLIFLLLYGLKKLLHSILPPEWFLHDINTGYVFLSVFITWALSYLLFQKLGTIFIMPMIFSVILAIVGFYSVHRTSRYLVPGCAILLADIVWQVVRMMQESISYQPEVITTQAVLIIAIILGTVWLMRKPSILPVAYLALFQLIRFAGFVFQALQSFKSQDLAVVEVMYYFLYLVCWMYIAPLLFWLIGFMHQDHKLTQAHERNTTQINKLLAQRDKK